MLIIAAIVIVVLVAIMFFQAYYLRKQMYYKDFWFDKWRIECDAHVATIREAQANEQGIFEIQENYEMDLLTARERIHSLQNFKDTYDPNIDHWIRLDRFHKETCAPLLAQVKRGAR